MLLFCWTREHYLRNLNTSNFRHQEIYSSSWGYLCLVLIVQQLQAWLLTIRSTRDLPIFYDYPQTAKPHSTEPHPTIPKVIIIPPHSTTSCLWTLTDKRPSQPPSITTKMLFFRYFTHAGFHLLPHYWRLLNPHPASSRLSSTTK